MQLGGDDVRAIAYEARLSLTDDELGGAVRYINTFLGMADTLKELDLKNTEPFRFAESKECPLREDVAERFGRISEILSTRADASEADMSAPSLFKVPRIMEE